MTYPNDAQSTIPNDIDMPQPAWLKTLRYLVFGLMIASIFAMLSVGVAAYKLVSKPSSPMLPALITLPDGTTPISVTSLSNGDIIVVHNEGKTATIFDPNGKVKSEAQFK